jgi:TM2 domain-containing membrane protein YozV
MQDSDTDEVVSGSPCSTMALLCLCCGIFGGHRFSTECYLTGVIQLLTGAAGGSAVSVFEIFRASQCNRSDQTFITRSRSNE